MAAEAALLRCQETAHTACLSSSCVPQLPGQPLEQGAVGAAEMVALQAVGGHTNLFLGWLSQETHSLQESQVNEMLPRVTATAVGSMSPGCSLASCRGQKTLELNLWAFLRGQKRQSQDPQEQVGLTT